MPSVARRSPSLPFCLSASEFLEEIAAVPVLDSALKSKHGPYAGWMAQFGGMGKRSVCGVLAMFAIALLAVCQTSGAQVTNPTPINFGSSPVGTAQTQTTVTFTTVAGTSLATTPLVLMQGAANLDYTLGTGSTCTGTVSTSCTVNVVFTPKAPGQRFGAVQLMNSGGTAVLGTALLSGTGTGAVVVFPAEPFANPLQLGSGFSNLNGVAVDGAGNIYVADSNHNLVKEIVAVGGSIPLNPTILTLGSGFSKPWSVAVDGAGNVYVADFNNSAVKEMVAVGGSIPASPTILTLGSGFSSPRGVAVDGAGNVYVADTFNNAVVEMVAVGGSIPASPTILTLGSGFFSPGGLAVDGAGNVYVADTSNSVVKEIVAVGGSIPASPTILTLGTGFSNPSAVAVDAAGDVYVADSSHSSVKEMVAVGGSIPAHPTILTLSGSFNNPSGLTVDGAGNVYVADVASFVTFVREILASPPPTLSFSSTVVGSSNPGNPGTLLLQNIGNANLIFPIPASGTNPSTSVNYALDSGSTTCPQLTVSSPVAGILAPGTCVIGINFQPSIASTSPGSLVYFDNANNVIGASQAIVLTGTATLGAQTITFPQPTSPALVGGTATLTASSTSGLAIVYSVVSGPATISGSVVTYTGAGTVVLQADQSGNATYASATAVQRTVSVQPATAVGATSSTQVATVTIQAAGTLGTIYVLTTGQPNLDYTFVNGGTCATGTAYAIGNTCTVNYKFKPRAPGQRTGAVQLVSSGGTAVLGTTLLTGTGTGAVVVFPGYTTPRVVSNGPVFVSAGSAMAVDAAGNVYFTDGQTASVYECLAVGGSIPSNPTILTLGSGNFSGPRGVAVDGAGNVYVADTNDDMVKEMLAIGGSIPASPTIVTLATGLNRPQDVAVDGAGNVYFKDAFGVAEIVAVSGSIPASPTILALMDGTGGGPGGMAVDRAGNIYLAAYGNVLEIVAVGGSIPATPTIRTLGTFSNPEGVAVDAAGNVYVASDFSSSLFQIVAVGGIIPANPTILNVGSGFIRPDRVAVDGAGNVFVSDKDSGFMTEISPSLTISLHFATTVVGNTSVDSPATLYMQNIGNADLTFPIPTSGTNPTISPNYTFTNTSTPCPHLTVSSSAAGTLAPGLCLFGIAFHPVTPSAAAGSVVYFDNSNNVSGASQTIVLQGTAPVGTTAQTITFPQPTTPVAIGATVTLAASSTSGLLISYSVVSGPATISGSVVTYTGLGTVVLQADQNGDATYAAATAVQRIVSVQTLAAVGGASSTQIATVTVQTAGTLGAIYVLTTGQPNLDYTYVSGGTCATGTAYAVGNTCTVKYTFTPRAPGQRMGAVQLVDSSGTAVMGTTMLSWTGTGAAVVFPGNTTTVALNSSVLFAPRGVAVDAAGNVYVADTFNSLVKEIVAVGGSIPGNPTTRTLGSGFSYPMSLALDGAGNVYVADWGHHLVKEMVAVGGSIPVSPTILTLGSGFSTPQGVAVDGSGSVYVADYTAHSVSELVSVAGSIPASPTILTLGSGFVNPDSLAVDSAGNVYVVDNANNLVKEMVAVGGSIPATPTILTLGSGFISPGGVAVDSAGNVYVADTGNNLVKEMVAVRGSIPATPVILTLGSAFSNPFAVALDGAGNVYVADYNNNVVKEIPVSLPPSLSFATTAVGTTSSDSPKTLLVQNIGNANLTFPAPGTGTNPSISTNFTIGGTSTCPQVVAGGTAGSLPPGTCTDLVSFTPTAAGSISGSLVLTDNSLGATNAVQTAALSGTGVVPTVTSITPNTAVTGSANTTITIIGTNFANPSVAKFSGTSLTTTYLSALQVSAVVPASLLATPGTYDVTITTGGNTSATSTADQFSVRTAQTINFPQPTSPVTYSSGLTATLNATASSGLSVLYTVTSGPATVSGSTLTYTGPGTVAVAANQLGNGTYGPAPSVSVNITVNPATLAGYTVVGFPAVEPNGAANNVTVTARDSGGSAIVGYTGAVTLTSSDPNATLPGQYAYIASENGVHVFSVTLNTGGTRSITATRGGVSGIETGIVVDDLIWLLHADDTLTKFTNAGISAGSGASSATGTNGGASFDASGNIWTVGSGSNTLSESNKTGTNLAGTGFTGGGLNAPTALQVDGSGMVWVVNGNASVSVFKSNGTALTPSTGYTGGGMSSPTGLTVDSSGNVWVSNGGNNSVTEFIGGGSPTSQLATGVTNGTTGARP